VSNANPDIGITAACNVVGATGLRSGQSRGVSGTVRNAKGDYTITLSNQVDRDNATVHATLKTTQGSIAADQASDSTVNVLTTDLAGNPLDASFALSVLRFFVP